jgi:hypothetical protein
MARKTCAYGKCPGRVFGENGSREHTTCEGGRAALAALYARPDYAKVIAKRQAVGKAAFEAHKAKAAEPVKPVTAIDPALVATIVAQVLKSLAS